MATHYGPVPENIDEIAYAFGISEEVPMYKATTVNEMGRSRSCRQLIANQ